MFDPNIVLNVAARAGLLTYSITGRLPTSE